MDFDMDPGPMVDGDPIEQEQQQEAQAEEMKRLEIEEALLAQGGNGQAAQQAVDLEVDEDDDLLGA